MRDAQIRRGIASEPDVRPTDEEFWKDAKVVWPKRKAVVTMRLDADLLAWFRQQRGYQTRINAILRAYMKAHGSDERDLSSGRARLRRRFARDSSAFRAWFVQPLRLRRLGGVPRRLREVLSLIDSR